MALASRQLLTTTVNSVLARCYSTAGVITMGRASKFDDVPDLKKTKERFLRASKVVLANEDFIKTEKLADEFFKQGGDGEKLQKILVKRAQQEENWLTDWWLDAAYLELRLPLPVGLSPGIAFPKFNFSGTQGQIETTAELIRIFLMYKDLIETGQLPTDMAGNQPMDMSQYPLLFGTNRIPCISKDRLRYGNDEKIRIKHIIVAKNGHLFKVNVFDDSNNPLGILQLVNQLNKVSEQAQTSNHHPIGVCSSQERNTWAKIYESLKKNSQNASHLEDLETGLFFVSLERTATPSGDRTELDEHGRQALHGSGSASNSGNRWWDKTLQLLVNTNGYVAMAYEHSPAEGPPVASLVDYAIDQHAAGSARHLQDAMGSYTEPERLDFVLADEDKKSVDAAAKRFDAVAEDIELKLFKFTDFGKSVPKAQKISPDSYCQLAFQLAYYKMHKSHAPTYETGTLRTFNRGRTETIRLPTGDSAAFAEAMLSNKSNVEKAQLIRKAVDSHKEYMIAVRKAWSKKARRMVAIKEIDLRKTTKSYKEIFLPRELDIIRRVAHNNIMKAMSGNGMDRHFIGFLMAAKENGLPIPEILSSPGYTRLSHFNMSTSQVPTKNDVGFLFGPSASDCYAICYNPQENQISLSITAFKHNKDTSAKKFAEVLSESFHDMRKVLEAGTKSKL